MISDRVIADAVVIVLVIAIVISQVITLIGIRKGKIR